MLLQGRVLPTGTLYIYIRFAEVQFYWYGFLWEHHPQLDPLQIKTHSAHALYTDQNTREASPDFGCLSLLSAGSARFAAV